MNETIPIFEIKEEAVSNATDHAVGDQKARVMRPEYLVAIMLQVGRPAKDLPRAALFAEQAPLDRFLLDEILVRYDLRDRWQKIQG